MDICGRPQGPPLRTIITTRTSALAYIDKLLGSNERIVFRTRRHFFTIFGELVKELLILVVLVIGFIAVDRLEPGQAFFFHIAFGVVAAIALISMIVDLVKWRNEEFVVTSRRVIQCSGVVNKKVLDSSLSKINDVVLEQSFFGRIFNYGTIKILTATDEVINLLDKITGPLQFKHAMLNAKAELEPSAISSGLNYSPSQLLEELSQLKAKNMISEEEYQQKRKEILKRM
jgi:uncharacterized membrane protein YdbT with pleckstrin-like domain